MKASVRKSLRERNQNKQERWYIKNVDYTAKKQDTGWGSSAQKQVLKCTQTSSFDWFGSPGSDTFLVWHLCKGGCVSGPKDSGQLKEETRETTISSYWVYLFLFCDNDIHFQ